MDRELEHRAAIRTRMYERWAEHHPEAASELQGMREGLTDQAFQAWKGRFPEALDEYARIGLYTEDVVRKARLAIPTWAPSDPDIFSTPCSDGALQRHPCPCCGFLTLPEEPPGTFWICPVCRWEDDDIQFAQQDYRGGANTVSLREARENFRLHGASDLERRARVRAPLPDELPPRGE